MTRRILYAGEVVHDPLFGPCASSATLRLEDGSAGSLSFTVPPNHPLAGKMATMDATREVTVEVDGEEVFRGRLLSGGSDVLACEAYEAAGMLSYLSDSVLRPYGTYESDEWSQIAPREAGELYRWYVARHNDQVGAEKRFVVGRCEASGNVTRSSTQKPTTRDEARDKIEEPFSMSQRARMVDGTRVLDLLADGDGDCGQEVAFGENLLDLSIVRDASDVVTEIVPTATGGDEPFGLEAVSDGTYYGCWVHGDSMRDAAAARRYGVVQAARDYDVATEDGLLRACSRDLSASADVLESVECSAADFSVGGSSAGPIRLLRWVLVTSEPHSIRQRMMCSAMTLDLLDASNDRYTFGALLPTLTRAQARATARSRVAADESARVVAAISQEAKDAALVAEEAGKRAESADSTAQDAQAGADSAKDAAGKAAADAKDASDKAIEAKSAADEATAKTEVVESQVTEVRQSAKSAQDAADAAQATAADAQGKADAAESAAGVAQGAAQAAQGSALEAATEAGKAVSVANEAKKQIGDVAADAVKLREDLEGQISSVTTIMEADYTKKTDLTATESKLITQIERSAAAIKLEASQSYAKKTDLTDVETALNAKIEVNASGIEQAVKEVTTAKADASDAKTKAQAAETAAGAASSEAARAAAAASGAQGAADAAKADAITAQQKANDAKSAADKAKEDYDALSVRADVTDEQLAAAQAAVDAANKAAGTAQSAADAAKGAASTAQSTADKAKADSATAKAAADAATAKADEAAGAVAGLEGRVTTAETKIAQNADAITLRATKTEAQGYASTAKSEAVSAAAGDATTKANNALASAKTYADAQIKVSADSITSSVSKTYATQATVNAVKSTADAAKTGAATAQTTADTANNRATYKYGTCATAAATAAKAVALAGFALFVGATVTVRFDAGNTAASPTLNVNGTGAKAVVINGSAAPSAALAAMAAYATATFTYDGTYWRMSGTDQATVDAVSAKSEIKQQADRITSNVAETTKLGTRMSTVEQTASGLSVSLGNTDKAVAAAQSTANTAKTNAATAQTTANTANGTANTAKTNAATAQSTADTAKANAATAQGTANTANSTANTAKTNAATAQSTANTARTEAANAAKTATNYMEYSSAGLDVGNKSSGKWAGFRTRMASSAFQVLDAAGAVLASYGASLVELGKNSLTAVVSMCGGRFRISGKANSVYGEGMTLESSGDLTMSAGSGRGTAGNVYMGMNISQMDSGYGIKRESGVTEFFAKASKATLNGKEWGSSVVGGWQVVRLGNVAIVTALASMSANAYITNGWGVLYESDAFALPDYPVAFKSIPWSSVEYVNADGGGSAAFVERTPSSTTAKNPGAIYFVRPNTGTLGHPVVAITAIGTV